MSSSHRKAKTSAVPKFTSFRPKAPDSAQSTLVREPVPDDKSKSNPGAPHPSQADSSRARPERDAYSSARSKPHPTRGVEVASTERKPVDNVLFCVDKRGDPLIRRYGGNDRRAIPEYRRIGAGRVLGHDGFMRIERQGNREEFYFPDRGDSRPLLSNDKKRLLAKGLRLDRRPIRLRRKEPETGAVVEDFLPLKTPKKRRRDALSSGDSSGEEGPSYRSIHGKSKNHEHSDSDEAFDSDASGEALKGVVDDPLVTRSIELSRKVREHPEDVDSWLELVDHQNNLLLAQTGGRAPTAAEIKSFADIKLSLLEQALSHAKDDTLRERLTLKVLAEGVKVWEPKSASKKIKETLQKYPESFEIWKVHVAFLQTTLSLFSYEDIKQLYTDKLQSLGRKLAGYDTVEDQIRCSEQIIHVFLLLTRCLADAGFVELASAAWQATLELNLARPPTVSQTGWEIPSSFQEYWESEIPRLGEAEWKGWESFITDSNVQEPANPKTSQSPPITPNTRDGYKAWHMVESQRARDAAIPARTLDEGAEDDPFRVVMYSDFQDMLLYFPTNIIPQLRRQLLDAFLIFSHLPPSTQGDDVIGKAKRDQFLARSVRLIPFAHLSPRGYVDQSEEQQSPTPEFSPDIHDMLITPDVLFPSKEWFGYIGRMRDIVSPDHYQWVSATLKHISRTSGASELGPYVLAFESTNEPGNEKRSAKALLKSDPSNVDLYMGYSILEYERGNKAAARNVLTAALGLPSILDHDRVRIGVSAAWLELIDGELAKAVLRLCGLVTKSDDGQSLETVEATSSQILKAHQLLVTNRDYKISSGEIGQAVIYAEALVLLEYLTKRSEKEPMAKKQGDVWSAIVSITQCSDDLVSRGQQHNPSHERFLQFAARILYYHARHGSLRPGLFREQLEKYLSYFPSNTIFLSLYAWRTERLSINDRVRVLLQDKSLTRTNESLSSHIFAIRHELCTGNTHSARAAFERALASDVCAHHVGLWIAYIRLCRNNKSVFYRAIQACPWSKDVFMEAFGTLVRDMDSAELKSVYATMCQKGIRVHVDMDEFVDRWRREYKDKDKDKDRQRKI
ncbi:DUF1740-domain-containing protein [Poronia punctata]|nr:DUF1740-domain-containing protein [Poronia punctata]